MRFARLAACLLALASAACATTGAVPRPFPMPGADGTATPAHPPLNPPLKLDGGTIAGTALALRGVRYRPGGDDLSGFDCSGLVVYVFAQHGIGMPRLVREQYEIGRRVKPAALKPGDLLFFSTKGGGASHVAIAIRRQPVRARAELDRRRARRGAQLRLLGPALRRGAPDYDKQLS